MQFIEWKEVAMCCVSSYVTSMLTGNTYILGWKKSLQQYAYSSSYLTVLFASMFKSKLD
jgi:hypothetical protein